MTPWKEYKLKDLTLKIGSGATPRGGQESYKDKGISLIRSQNVLDYKLSYNGLAFIDEYQARELENVKVEEKDILLNITGDSVARACMVPYNVLPARVNQHVSIIRVNQKFVDPNFILYYLLNPKFKKYMLKIASDGGTRNALTKGDIENFCIKLPKLSEQTKISNVLSRFDKRISLLRRENETLEGVAQVLFKRWFVEFEFPNEEGKPYKSAGGKMTPSPLGKIPTHFKVAKVGTELEILGGGTPSTIEPSYWENGNINWYTPSDLTSSNMLFSLGSEKNISEKGLNNSSARLFPEYSLMMTSRATIGEIAINIEKACTNQGFIVLVPNENYPIYFLHGWLLKQLNMIKRLASGSTFPEMSRSEFKNLDIIKVPKRTMKLFSCLVEPIYKKIENNIKESRSLTLIREGVLPELMGGRIRVGDAGS